jgi:hypothetical protein
MESMADLLIAITLWLEVCPFAGFLCRAASNILLLSFTFSYLSHPDTYSEGFYSSFALQISTRPNRTPIQNP